MITTLDYANRLKNAGCEPKVAEELAKMHGEIHQDLVTRSYLMEQFNAFEQRIVIKLGSLMIIGMGILGFILKH